MICLDTNIIIYLVQGRLSAEILPTTDIAYASVVKIEALGYARLTMGEERAIRQVMEEDMVGLALSDVIIERAIGIRQMRKIGLGDAIVAATALECDCELWTANTVDFAGIDRLKLHNPL